MQRNTLRALGALMIVVLAAGCAAMGRQAFAPPVVTVEGVRLVGVGLQGGTLDVELSLYNPNNYRLDARRFTYRVMVDSLTLGQGEVTQRMSVMGRDSTRVKLPVSFGVREVLVAGSKLMQRGTVPYRLVGDITVATPFGDMTRPYDQKGTFNTGDLNIR